MADCWAERMVMLSVISRAGWMAVNAAVKGAGSRAMNWVD